ncbi:uncharacterized protein TNCV_4568451 [Trichonephila clavipes]|nr:uncharacterized protein TNCV_4568451 [Trichonephila clavipes]
MGLHPTSGSYKSYCDIFTEFAFMIIFRAKVLEVFHNFPSDIESEESSLNETEDVMTAKSSSSKNTDIDEEKDDISVPGPSRISKVTWKNKASVKIRNIPFTEQSGPSDEITSLQDPSPIKIFFTLFSISFIETTVYQTNLYAMQKGNAFTPVIVQDKYSDGDKMIAQLQRFLVNK